MKTSATVWAGTSTPLAPFAVGKLTSLAVSCCGDEMNQPAASQIFVRPCRKTARSTLTVRRTPAPASLLPSIADSAARVPQRCRELKLITLATYVNR